MIRIICKNNGGFRRAGLYHQEGTREYPDNAFTPEQMKQLKAEPLLVVQEVPDEPASDDTEKTSGEVNPESMTMAQLQADLGLFLDAGTFKGMKKADLISLWTATRNDLQALAGKGAV